MIEIKVYDNQVGNALKALKRQLRRDGLLKELKTKRFHEKPSVRKKRKQKESQKRRRRQLKKEKYFSNKGTSIF